MSGLSSELLHQLREARKARGWSQAELGRRMGLPQMHISRIESGKVTPRYDTVVELARTLGFDLVMVPKPVVPVVRGLTRAAAAGGTYDQPLYVPDEEEMEG